MAVENTIYDLFEHNSGLVFSQFGALLQQRKKITVWSQFHDNEELISSVNQVVNSDHIIVVQPPQNFYFSL